MTSIDYEGLAKSVCDAYPEKVQLYKETQSVSFLLATLLNKYKQQISPKFMHQALIKELESRHV